MPVVTGPAGADGAFVPVSVGPTQPGRARMRRTRRPVPAAQRLSALIDTGAEITCIDTAATTRLGLTPERFGSTNAPAVGVFGYTPFYKIELTIPHPTALPSQYLVIPDLEVVELDLASLGYDAVLGRDVLAHCVLIYDGLSGAFTLSY